MPLIQTMLLTDIVAVNIATEIHLFPISLINVDRKILTAMLAKRLQPPLSFIIKNDQARLIKTRQATDNIRLAVDLMALNMNEDQFVIPLLEAERAFDKILYVFAVLNRLRFPLKFIKFIKIPIGENIWSSG